MTSKSDKSIQKADITRMAFNQGSLGMEFSWNYERQMHIAFAMMMNKILKKVYAEDEEGYRDAPVSYTHLDVYKRQPYDNHYNDFQRYVYNVYDNVPIEVRIIQKLG